MIEQCLIIGLGNIGLYYDINRKHILTHSKALFSHPNFELLGGVDDKVERRNLFSKNYNKPNFKTIHEALKKTNPTMIVISTSTETHYTVFKEIIKYLVPKIILCEKPIDFEYSKSKEIVEVCSKHNILLFINYIRASDPGVIQVKSRILREEFGVPSKSIVWYSKGLFNNGSHYINLLESWFGKVKELKIINKGRLINDFDLEPDFIIYFERLVTIFCAAKEENFSYLNLEILTSKGKLTYSNEGNYITWQNVMKDKVFRNYNILDQKIEIIENDMKNYQYNVLEQISNFLRNKQSYLCTGIDALRTLENVTNLKDKIIND